MDNQELTITEIKDKMESVSNCLLACKLVDGKKMFQHKGHYYADLIPPNWEQSVKHQVITFQQNNQSAQQVAHQRVLLEGQEHDLCPCCQQQIEKIHINLCDNEIALAFLGSGYPLYFNFMRYSILIIGILFMTSGQFNLVSNLQGQDCLTYEIQITKRYGDVDQSQNNHKQTTNGTKLDLLKDRSSNIVILDQVQNYCQNDYIAITSMANRRFDRGQDKIGDYLIISSTIVILVIIFLFRKSQLQIDTICDIQENTPPDYTLMCTGFPQVQNPKQEIENFFSNYVPGSTESEHHTETIITKINLVYFLDELNKIKVLRADLIVQKQKALSKIPFGTDLFLQTMWNFDQLILIKQQEIKKKSQDIYNDPSKFSGVAFISFQKEDQKQYILKKCHISAQSMLYNCFFGCLVQTHKSIIYQDTRVEITQAPEPTDIIWENIVHDGVKRMSLRIFGWLFSRVVICSFIITLLWTAKQQSLYQEAHVLTTQKTIQTASGDITIDEPLQGVHFFPILYSLFTVFINSFVVDKMSRFLVKFESYETYSLYNVSLAQKLALTLFFNSALVAFISCTYFTHNFYGVGGLIYIQIYFFMSNAFVPPIINIIDPDRIIKKMTTWWYRKQGNQCILTQSQANLLYEHPEHEIELRYADILKTLFLTFFYAPLIPFGYILSFIALCLYYWVEKYVLLRRQSVKHTPSIQLSLMMTEMLELLPILYALANLIFKYQLSGYISFLATVPLILSVTNSIMPMQYFVDLYFTPQEQDETTTYEEAFPNFQTDYEFQNPITKNLVDDDIFEYKIGKIDSQRLFDEIPPSKGFNNKPATDHILKIELQSMSQSMSKIKKQSLGQYDEMPNQKEVITPRERGPNFDQISGKSLLSIIK